MVAGACTGSEPPPSSAKSKCTWAIGTMGALTGSESKEMVRLFRAIELAVDTVEEQGDIACDLELVSEDTAGGLDQVRARANALTKNERLIACVCPYRSDETLVSGAVFDSSNILMTGTGTNDAIAEQGFDTWFATLPSDMLQGRGTAEYIVKAAKPSAVAVVDDGSGSGMAVADTVAAGLGDLVVERQSLEGSDPVTVAAGIKKAAPQLVYFAGDGGATRTLVQALRAAAVDAPVLIGGREPASLPTRDDLAGLSDVVIACPCVDPVSVPAAIDFVDDYSRAHDELPGPFAAELYDVTGVVTDALTGLEADAPIDDVRAAVLDRFRDSGRARGVSGRLRWDDAGARVVEPLDAIWIYEWNDGRATLEVIGPASALV